jgi:hypothetical protein
LIVIRLPNDLTRTFVVHVRKSNAIIGSNGMTNDNLMNIIKFIPILLIIGVSIAKKGLKFGTTRDGNAKGLGGEESLLVEEVEIVGIDDIGQQRRSEAKKDRQNLDGQLPVAISAIDDNRLAAVQVRVFFRAETEWLVVVEPGDDGRFFLGIQLQMNGVGRVLGEDVFGVVDGRLCVVEGRELDAVE